MKYVQLLLLGLLSVVCAESHEREGAEYDLFYEAPSHNYVIRWAFQAICDFSFDSRNVWPTTTKAGGATFDPSQVRPGDTVFVRDAPHFFKTMHHKIKVPYFILTHGEYLDTFQDSYFKYANEEKVLAWFTIHPPKKQHQKVFPIALGIVQYYDLYEKRADVHKQFLKYRSTKKEKLLYMNFTDWRNPQRKKIRDFFLEKTYCNNGRPCRFNQYIKETAQHKFIISPPGLGPDLYRIYEALLVGTIPVVKHSHLDYLYEGLPLLYVDDWEEVTEEFLHKKYAEITSKKYNPKKLYMEYWLEQIELVKASILKAHNIHRA